MISGKYLQDYRFALTVYACCLCNKLCFMFDFKKQRKSTIQPTTKLLLKVIKRDDNFTLVMVTYGKR